MSLRELTYWRAFDGLEPIGFRGQNWLFARLQQTLLMASPKFKTDSAPSLDKLLLDFDPDPETFMTDEEREQHQAQQLKNFFNSF